MEISQLADNYSVSSQISPDDVADLASAGYSAVICNRPDDEDAGQPSAESIAAACEQYGLEFHHLPVAGMPVAEEIIDNQKTIIRSANGKVLGYCRSGQRSAYIHGMGAG